MKKNTFKILLLAIALPINSYTGDIYDGLKNGLKFLFKKINTLRLCPSRKKQNKKTTNAAKSTEEQNTITFSVLYLNELQKGIIENLENENLTLMDKKQKLLKNNLDLNSNLTLMQNNIKRLEEEKHALSKLVLEANFIINKAKNEYGSTDSTLIEFSKLKKTLSKFIIPKELIAQRNYITHEQIFSSSDSEEEKHK